MQQKQLLQLKRLVLVSFCNIQGIRQLVCFLPFKLMMLWDY